MKKTLLLFVFMLVQASPKEDYNFAFCGLTMLNPYDGNEDVPAPDLFFFDDFELNAEQHGSDFVKNAFHRFSKTYQIIKTTEESLYGTNLIVSDAKFRVFMNFNKTSEKCTEATYAGHTHNDFVHAFATSNHWLTVKIDNPQSLVEWTESAHLTHFYKRFINYTELRGIPVAHWQSCDYDHNFQQTAVIDWYISDDRFYTVPAGQKKILISKVNSYDDKTVIGTDYSMLREIPDYRLLRSLQRPAVGVCKTDSLAANLPRLPRYFSFMGEFAYRSFPIAKNIPTSMGIVNEVYDFDNNLFIITAKSAGDKEEIQTTIKVLDFNTGVRYILNYNTQSCTADNDIHLGIAEVPITQGNVRMRTPKEFFDLDKANYEYFGRHEVRGFQCDTWTSFMNDNVPTHLQNTTYTWHFMTRNQMFKLGYSVDEARIPVRLVTTNANGYEDTDFFHFNTNQRLTVPVSLDLCFTHVKTKTVKMSFFGSFKKQIVKKAGIIKFTEEFRASLMRYSKVGTPLRFSDITPRSNLKDKNEIIVSFRLYPLLKHGNIVHNTDTMTTSDVLRNLKQTVDRGIFVVDLGKTYLVAKIGSLQTIENPGQAVHATTRKLTGISEIDDDAGYSSGAMAGLGIAMIILGVVVGAGALFLYKRFRNTAVDAQFSMSKVKENTDA